MSDCTWLPSCSHIRSDKFLDLGSQLNRSNQMTVVTIWGWVGEATTWDWVRGGEEICEVNPGSRFKIKGERYECKIVMCERLGLREYVK